MGAAIKASLNCAAALLGMKNYQGVIKTMDEILEEAGAFKALLNAADNEKAYSRRFQAKYYLKMWKDASLDFDLYAKAITEQEKEVTPRLAKMNKICKATLKKAKEAERKKYAKMFG